MIKKKLGEITGTVKEVMASGLPGPLTRGCRACLFPPLAEELGGGGGAGSLRRNWQPALCRLGW